MAVTMVVEDGTIVENANSYVSISYANTYLERNIHKYTTWENLSDDDKSALLVWSSSVIDNYFNFEGLRMTGDQDLRWPRYGAYDLDGYLIPNTEIPRELKDSVCELALAYATEDRLDDPDTAGISELKVDVIELKFDKIDRPIAVPANVQQMMRTIGVYVGPGLGRIRFGRVYRT